LASPPVCTGTPEAPGLLAGNFPTTVTVEGVCAVNGGVANVRGNVVVRPGAVLLAAFALNGRTGIGPSRLAVFGDIRIQSGATAILGCDPKSSPCIDAPSGSSRLRVFGNVNGQEALGVIVHNATINGSVTQTGGGGGFTCEEMGFFKQLESPVFSAYEDSQIFGSVSITDVNSCWMGLARLTVGANVRIARNKLADPDAIEILANRIAGNLACTENSMVWNSAEKVPSKLFPRIPMPNTVLGRRTGQCVHASPTEEGGPPGEGPF
jgi:hypothetical protein